ncbi:hypothetical protein [Nitrosomonas marina]|nr:hypothetical protein [Nitrosomonas marina]
MHIITNSGKVFNMLITQQQNNTWIATVIYEINSTLQHENIHQYDRNSAYQTACDFIKNNIDRLATIQPL